MMYEWKPEHIRFMRDAASYGKYHRLLAEKLLPHLPQGGRICDAGCGMGYLSQALSPYFQEVTACDVAQSAMEELQRRVGEGKNLRFVCGDILDNPPETPYDGMIFCLFGSWELILRVAKEQCRGPVCVICRANRIHRFSAGYHALHTNNAGQLESALQQMQVAYHQEVFSLEFGQPFHTQEDALAFFRLYNRGDGEVTESDVLPRLAETGRVDFPLYLPQKKELSLFCFDSRDIR